MNASPRFSRLASPLRSTLFALLAAAACGDAPNDADDGVPQAEHPAAVDLGAVDCGGATTGSFELRNTGGAALDYDLTAVDPRVTVAGAAGTIEPGGRRTIQVSVAMPADVDAATDFRAALAMTTNQDDRVRAIELTFRSRGAQLSMTPPSLALGETAVGTSIQRSFTITNSGDLPASVHLAMPAGDISRQFGSDGVATLAPGAEVTGLVTYLPTDLGTDTATADVELAGVICGAAPRALRVDGAGVEGGGVLVQSGSLDFGAVTCDGTTDTETVTIINQSQIAVPFSAAFDAPIAGITVTPSAGTIQPGGRAELQVRRAATAIGATIGEQRAQLNVTATLGTDRTVGLPVRRVVESAVLQLRGAGDFGPVRAGERASLPFEVQNVGNRAARVLVSTSDEHLAATVPDWLDAGVTTSATVTYTAASIAPWAGTVTLRAEGSCAAPVGLGFAANHGPIAELVPVDANFWSCPLPPSVHAGMDVANRGDRPLVLTCTTSYPGATVFPATETLDPGAQSIVSVRLPSAGLGAGRFEVPLTCTTNEAHASPRQVVLSGVVTCAGE